MDIRNFLNLLLPFLFLIIFAIIAIANRIAEERRRAARQGKRPLERGPQPGEGAGTAKEPAATEVERFLAEMGLAPAPPKPGEEVITITEEHLARPVRVPGRPPKRGVPRRTLEVEHPAPLEEDREPLLSEQAETGAFADLAPVPQEIVPEGLPEMEGVPPLPEVEAEISVETPEKAPPPPAPAPSRLFDAKTRFKPLRRMKVSKPSERIKHRIQPFAEGLRERLAPAAVPKKIRLPSARIALSPSTMRTAIIYREILSPPVGLRLLRRRKRPLPKQKPV